MTMHLVHAPLDLRAFNRWAGYRGLVRRGVYDADYALHVLLTAMFGRRALQPFRLFWSERRRYGALYAYADHDQEALREIAAATAPPDCCGALDPGKLCSKPMPVRFPRGRRLGFDLRARPVRRLRNDLYDGQARATLTRGREVDAHRLALMQRYPDGWKGAEDEAAESGMTRESTYAEWVAERLAGAAHVEECRLAAFRRVRALRGDGRGPEGPDATLHGVCAVEDPDAFVRRLREGVGRHRAYGYGMLLLRPPDRAAPRR